MHSTTEYFHELLYDLYNSSRHLNTTRLNINDTVDTSASGTRVGFLLYAYLVPIIGTIIILINLVVIISSGLILKTGKQPKSMYLFLGNVAMTDLITAVAVVFGNAFPKGNRDHYLCAVQLGMIVSSTLTSVYSVGLIAIDRYLYILHGLHYQRWLYPTRARVLICISWTVGITIGFLPLMGWYGDTDNGKICWFIILAPKGLVLLTVTIGAIPLILVISLYSNILYRALKKVAQLQQVGNHAAIQSDPSSGNIRMFRGQEKQPEGENEGTEKERKGILSFLKKETPKSVKSPNRWKAIKVVLFTTGSFVITWTPYFITAVIYVFNCDIANTSKKCKTMRSLIASPLAILGFMNSLLNPIIYAWWHKGFRHFVKKKVNTVIMRKTSNTGNRSDSTSETSASRHASSAASRKIKQVPKTDSNRIVE